MSPHSISGIIFPIHGSPFARGEMLKLTLDQYLETKFKAERPEWKMEGRMRQCRYTCNNANNVFFQDDS